MPESAICLFGKDLLQINWADTLYQLDPDTLADKLDQILDEKINKFFPTQELTIDTTPVYFMDHFRIIQNRDAIFRSRHLFTMEPR